jgi:CIC family chloride channel protein
MHTIRVGEAMQELPETLAADLLLLDVVSRLERSGADGLPVVDADGNYRGVVVAAEVDQAARDDALETTAAELAREVTPLQAGETLERALPELLLSRSGLPVVDDEQQRVIGWLTQVDLLRAYQSRLGEWPALRTPGQRARRRRASPV